MERRDDVHDSFEPYAEETDRNREGRERVGLLSGWGISLAMHAVVAMVLAFVVIASRMVPEYPLPQMTTIQPPLPPRPDSHRRRTVEPSETTIRAEEDVEEPVVHDLQLQVEELDTTENVDAEDWQEAKVRTDAEALREVGGEGAFIAMGPGGADAGAFAQGRGARRRQVGRRGGTPGSENAVEAALRWFQRHQSPNGQWDVDGYPVNCTRAGDRCEPGRNLGGADEAVTGYALLCYLGAGYDHRFENRYRGTIKMGLDWLVRRQSEDGAWGRNYENGVCTMALAEAYAMSMDPRLREPAQKGVDNLRREQNPGAGKDAYGGSGWNYNGPNAARNDSSVTGWCVMAMKSAEAAGLDVQGGLEGSKWWLDHAWKATNPNWERLDPYEDTSRFPYTYDEIDGRTKRDHLSCVGGLCAVFLGHGAGDVMLETLTNDIVARHLDKSRTWPTDSYYLYYNTLAVFQNGGEKWERWNAVVRDMLVDSQRRGEGCFDGSWDPAGAGGHRIAEVGRTLVTAYACLSLEVYYRYPTVGVTRDRSMSPR